MLVYMSEIVHARLDPETRRVLKALKHQFGWNDSEVVRRAINALGAACLSAAGGHPPIRGLGEYASGISDLGSNPEHLNGFGR